MSKIISGFSQLDNFPTFDGLAFHCFGNILGYLIGSLLQWVSKKVSISFCRLRLGMTKQRPDEVQVQATSSST